MIIFLVECVFRNVFFTAYYKSRLSVGESTTVSLMSELLKLRDNNLYFSGDFHLDQVDIATCIFKNKGPPV